MSFIRGKNIRESLDIGKYKGIHEWFKKWFNYQMIHKTITYSIDEENDNINITSHTDPDLRGDCFSEFPDNVIFTGDIDMNHHHGDLVIAKNLRVKGYLKLYNQEVTFKDENITVDNDLILEYCELPKGLPKNTKVGGNLYLKGSAGLIYLPENLVVNGDLDIRDTKIDSLPESLIVKGKIRKDFFINPILRFFHHIWLAYVNID